MTMLPEFSVTVDAQAMKPVALLLRDPNMVHLDPNVVSALGLGDRVINQGPINAGYVWEMLERWLGDTAVVRTLDIRFTNTAYAGDELTAGGTVEKVDGQGRPTACDVWLRRADGDTILRGTATIHHD